MKFVTVLALVALFAGRAFATSNVVVAHRGASGYLPEHSLPAKAMAYAQGADYLEQDLALTKDGVPIVIHDVHLDTVTDVAIKFCERKRRDGRYYVIDFTRAEIDQLNAIQRFNHENGAPAHPGRFPVANYRGKLHTFEEEILFLQGLNRSTGRRVGLYTEIKQPTFHRREGQDVARIVVGILTRHGYSSKSDPCWIQCFEQTTVRRLRVELGWKGNLMMALGGDKPGADGTDFDRLATPKGMTEIAAYADAIGPRLGRVISWDQNGKPQVRDFTRDAHAAGLQVHWGVVRADNLPPNCPSLDALHEALFNSAGTEGGFTDFPDRTVQWLKDHKRR